MNLDLGQLIQSSFKIAWRHKTLWIFGLFTGAGTGALNTDLDDFTRQDISARHGWDDFGPFGEYLTDWDIPEEAIPAFVGVLLLWGIAIGLLLMICSLIAKPAMIDGINKITRGGQYKFGTSFSRGIDFFWRFLGITVIKIFSFFVPFVIAIVLAAALSPWTLLLTLPFILIFGFFWYHTFSLAEVAIVARDMPISDAIAEGWELLMRSKGNCFIISLMQMGLGFAFVMIITLGTLAMFAPINILVGVLTEHIVVSLLLSLLIALPISIVLGGYTGTFFEALYIQFYFRLVEPPQQLSTDLPTGSPGPVA